MNNLTIVKKKNSRQHRLNINFQQYLILNILELYHKY